MLDRLFSTPETPHPTLKRGIVIDDPSTRTNRDPVTERTQSYPVRDTVKSPSQKHLPATPAVDDLLARLQGTPKTTGILLDLVH
jgi:hypothetical protein